MTIHFTSTHFSSSHFAGNQFAGDGATGFHGHHWLGKHWATAHFATTHFRGNPSPIVTKGKHWAGNHWLGRHWATRHFHGLQVVPPVPTPPPQLGSGTGRMIGIRVIEAQKKKPRQALAPALLVAVAEESDLF